MMMNSFRFKLKGIFLLWAISNVNFCVVGHPMQAAEALHVAGGAKPVDATAHGENVLQVAHGFEHQNRDGKQLETLASVRRPKDGSQDPIIVEEMGKGHLNGIKALHEQPKNDLLGTDGTSLASQVDDSKLTAQVPESEGVKASEQPPKPNGLQTEHQPDPASSLDTSAGPATKNLDVEKSQGTKTVGQAGKEFSPARSISKATQATLKKTQNPDVKVTEETLLKSVPKGKKTAAEATSKIRKPDNVFVMIDPEASGGKMKYLNLARVKELSPQDLIRYMAERDLGVESRARDLDQLAKQYYLAQDAAFKALSEDPTLVNKMNAFVKVQKDRLRLDPNFKNIVSKEEIERYDQPLKEAFIKELLKERPVSKISNENVDKAITDMQTARLNWDRGYAETLKAAKRLIPDGSLTSEALSKLTNVQYVRWAGLYEAKVMEDYGKWLVAGESFLKSVRKLDEEFVNSFGKEAVAKKMSTLFKDLKKNVVAHGESTDSKDIKAAAEREFIKQAKVSEEKNIRNAASAVENAKKSLTKAENAAVNSADLFFKRNKLLKTAALRYKHTGWSFDKFMKKILDWIFRRGRKGQQNREGTATVKPSTADGPTEKTVSESAPKEDVTKPVDQLEKNVVNPEHTPEVPKQPASDEMPIKNVDTPGDADLKGNPSFFHRYFPSWTNQASSAENPNLSQESRGSWWPLGGKNVQPVENEAEAVQKTASPANGWFPWLKRNPVSPESEKAPLLGSNPTVS